METNRSCPFSCTYCDWGSATTSKLAEWIWINWVKLYGSQEKSIYYVCDTNFGMLPRDMEISKMAIEMKRNMDIRMYYLFRLQNAREDLMKFKLLYEIGMHKSVNMAMQSMNLTALKNKE